MQRGKVSLNKLGNYLIGCVLFGCSAAVAEQAPVVDTVVVCAPELRQAAEPWLDYRQSQGHGLAIISGNKTHDQIKATIRQLAQRSALRFVVLIGDAPAHDAKRATDVETKNVPADVILKWGAEPTFASDHGYCDLDDDGSPDLALGRICADSAAELTKIIDKILKYEASQSFTRWRRRVNLVAGVGGFGAVTDKVLESAAKKFITDGIPAAYQTSMTQASWRSSYSPDPRRFRIQTIDRMNQGCLAWVYLGHGRTRDLDVYRVPNGGLPILSSRDVRHIAAREGFPIAVFLSCYAGAFDAEPNCLAEELLSAPKGPVCVVAGSSVTMPYAMTVMGNAMLKQLFVEKRKTIGEVLLHAKRELAQPRDPKSGQMIETLAGILSPDPRLLDRERQEHVRLFHLLGDPLLRIRYPRSILVKSPEYATAGGVLEVSGESDINGACVIELACRRDRLRFKPDHRSQFEATETWLSDLQATYEKANDSVWTSARQTIEDGSFSATLDVPADAWGPAHVRVYVEGERDFAMGSADVYLQLPKAETTE